MGRLSPNDDARTREYLRLLSQYEPRLRGFILTLCPNWADAEDIAQEVKLRLWEQFDEYDPAQDFGAGPAPSLAIRSVPIARHNRAADT